MFASETCALDSIGATYLRDVRPGEIVIADKRGLTSVDEHCDSCGTALCVFEHIYFARPDSIVDGAPYIWPDAARGRFWRLNIRAG